MSKAVMGWWFGRADEKLPHGDGRDIVIGETHEHTGPLELCRSGLHASEQILDALQYAPGPMLYRVRCSGEIIRGTDKLVCSRREYLAGADATDMLREFSRFCALDVSHLWDAPDVVIYWLLSGDPAARLAAESAARSVARLAAESAAWSAARSAARSAAWLDAESAAESAAWLAAWSAAESAAGSAAESEQNSVLDSMACELLGLEDAS